MKKKKETAPASKSKASLRVNKVRHVFPRNKTTTRSSTANAAADAHVEASSSGATSGSGGGAKKTAIPRSSKSGTKARVIRTVVKKKVAGARRRKVVRKKPVPEEDPLAQEKKVYRALKMLHIDFKGNKASSSTTGDSYPAATVTRNIKKKSTAEAVKSEGETVAATAPPPLMTRKDKNKELAAAAIKKAWDWRGKVRHRKKWTKKKKYKNRPDFTLFRKRPDSAQEDQDTDDKASEEPPLKKAKVKKTDATSTSVDNQDDLETADSLGEEKKAVSSEKMSQPPNRQNAQLKRISASGSGSIKKEDAESLKPKATTPKMGKGKAKVKTSSRSTEDKSSTLAQIKGVASSRSSSSSSTDIRSRTKDPSTSGDLARSSSLDNLLHKPDSPFALRKIRSQRLLSRSSTDVTRSTDRLSTNDDSVKTEPKASSSAESAVSTKGPKKRKHMSFSAERKKEKASSLKRKKLSLARLMDSSTRQIPNILFSGRPVRAVALADSPAISRESSPGSVPRIQRKKSQDTADSKPKDTDTPSVKDEQASSTQTRVKVSASESRNSRPTSVSTEKCDSGKTSKGTGNTNDDKTMSSETPKGRGRRVSKPTVGHHCSQCKDERCEKKELTADHAQRSTSSDGSVVSTEAIKRGPGQGRPKGSKKRRFRLNIVKGSSLQKMAECKRRWLARRLEAGLPPGRPKKTSVEGDSSQAAGQAAEEDTKGSAGQDMSVSGSDSVTRMTAVKELKRKPGRPRKDLSVPDNVQVMSVSDTDSVTQKTAVKLKELKRKPGRPRKDLSVPADLTDHKADEKSMVARAASEEICDVPDSVFDGQDMSISDSDSVTQVIAVKELKRKPGRPRKYLSVPADLTDHNMDEMSIVAPEAASEEISNVPDNVSDAEKTANNSDRSAEQTSDVSPISVKPCDASNSKYLSKGNTLSASTSAGKQKTPTKIDKFRSTRKHLTSKKNPLGPSVQLKRVNRRTQFKKSQWASGKLTKESVAALTSSVSLIKLPSVSTTIPRTNQGESEDKGNSTITEQASSGHLEEHLEELHSTEIDAGSDEPSSAEVSGTVTAVSNLLESVSSANSEEQSPKLNIDTDQSGDPSQHVHETDCVMEIVEKDTAAQNEALDSESQMPNKSDSTRQPGQCEPDDADMNSVKAIPELLKPDGPKPTVIPSTEPAESLNNEPQTDLPKDTPLKDEEQKYNADDIPPTDPLQSGEEEKPQPADNIPSSEENKEEKEDELEPEADNKEPPASDSNELSIQLDQEKTIVDKQSEKPDVQDQPVSEQSKSSAGEVSKEPSMGEPLEEPAVESQSESLQVQQSTDTKSDGNSTENQTEPPPMHSQSDLATESANASSSVDQTRDESEMLLKSDSESSFHSTEQLAGEQTKNTLTSSSESKSTPAAEVSTDSDLVTNVENDVPSTCVVSEHSAETDTQHDNQGSASSVLSDTVEKSIEGDQVQNASTPSTTEPPVDTKNSEFTLEGKDLAKETVVSQVEPSSDVVSEVEKTEAKGACDDAELEQAAKQKIIDTGKPDEIGAEQGAVEESAAEGEASEDSQKFSRKSIVPLATRKRMAINRELKRLQTDEGAQRIMSWHEKKKLKSLGKLLRSKIKDREDDEEKKKESREEQILAPSSSKMYSIDAISETRLVFKTGKSLNPEQASAAEPKLDPTKGFGKGSTSERRKKWKYGLVSVSSSLDSEDGPPPDITGMPPYKDSRSERCRSEELSPPPLILPEDLFSEKYYESMSASARHRPDTSISPGGENALSVFYRKETTVGTPGPSSLADIDTSQGSEASGAFTALNLTTKLGPKKRRGRGKRRFSKIGPASKTGREPHVRLGPVISKAVRRASSPKQDPSFIRAMPQFSAEPRTFALRPKMTRSPIEIIAMKQKLEEEAYELEEATRVARKLKRKQAHFDRLNAADESLSQSVEDCCKPCSVVLVDFVKELHLNSIDTSDQYISDVSYDSNEGENDEEDDDNFEDEIYTRQPDGSFVRGVRPVTPVTAVTPVVSTPSPEVKRTPEVKKSPPDLESLKGKGFMGNFVDFIQNRNKELPSLMPKPRRLNRPRTPVSSAPVSSGLSAGYAYSSSSAPVSCASAKGVAGPPLTSVYSASSASVVTVPSYSQVVTSAQVHVPQAVKPDHRTVCPEDKTVSSSPYQAAESSNEDLVEKTQHSHHPGLMTLPPEKSSPSGRLKVFPMRKEGDNADRSALIRYQCTKCEFSATNKGTMESHVYRHIPGVAFKCGYCDAEFTGLISALTHVRNIHNSKEPKVWISKDINEASLYTEEEIPCPGSELTSSHSSQHGGLVDSDPVVGQEGQPAMISLRVGGDRQNVQRPERFSSSPLASHRRFACTHCSYCTNVMDDAQQHVRDLHSDSSLFTCYLCDKAFGCSHQDILVHCRATHPDRPKSFKKLPDFYDQELIRVNSGSGERAKGVVDDHRGNIFDRMNNFFPNLSSSGAELATEDGQLSPQARFLRARDYLYIQEGWSRKTSAEADSTTIEDIEVPFEEATPDIVDSSALDSTTGRQSSGQPVTGSNKMVPAFSGGSSGSSAACSDSDMATKPASQSMSKDPSELLKDTRRTEGDASASGSGGMVGGSGDAQRTSAEHPKDSHAVGKSSSSAWAAVEGGHPGGSVEEDDQPAAMEGDDVGHDDDGENDILVIDLGNDVEDLAEDGSHCSSPREESSGSSLRDTSAHAADVTSPGKESVSPTAASKKAVIDSGVLQPSEGDNTAGWSGDTAEGSADDCMGIKILSVISLSDKINQDTETPVSPAKPQAGSKQDSSSSGGVKRPRAKKSPWKASQSGPPPKKKSKRQLSEVDADDVATRNERMVCTYKCHMCNIHSPALAAIVEHLKKHHRDVSLFSCPYCKAKKEAFFTEESVHRHVSQHHPTNYAKNEVSLSEVAKSFVQVLALPSGNRTRGSLIQEDIYMCLQCQAHVPDMDYALRHLKYEHPGALKYACPICGSFSDSLQDVVKKHMVEVHGLTPDSVQLAVAMEGVYLSKVACVSISGLYVDHSPRTPPRQTQSSALQTIPAGRTTAASAQSIPMTVTSAGLVSSTPVGVGPAGMMAFPQISPSVLFPGNSPVSPGRRRTKQPQPISPKKKGESFLATGMTVKDMLDIRQKTVPSSVSLSPRDELNFSRARSSLASSLGLGSMSNILSPSPTPTAPTLSSSSRPVLRVPCVSSVLDLTASRCMSVDTGTSVNTLASGGASRQTPPQSLGSKLAASLPFSISALTAPVSTVPSSLGPLPLPFPLMPLDREDPEAFKIFNLKPRTPAPQSPRPSPSPAKSVPALPSPAPASANPAVVTPGAVTMASSALFPQQFRLQQFPTPARLQPANIATLPLAQGGLPLALPIGAGGLPLSQGLTAIPLNVSHSQLLMAQNTFPPVLVPANLLSQLGLPVPGPRPLPQLPVVSGPAPPPAHQPLSEVQTAPVNLSLSHPSLPAKSVQQSPHFKASQPSSSSSSSLFSSKVGINRGRGRPKLLQKSPDPHPKPRMPGMNTLRFFGPSASTSSSSSVSSQSAAPERPASTPVGAASRQSDSSLSPTRPQKQGSSSSHQCVCPYCPDTLILKPWEVAQHIKMVHPGKEVKYNRV